MKEKRYMDDWVNVVSIDEKTGREKRTPEYRGDWYIDKSTGADKTRSALLGLAALMLLFGLFILYHMTGFPGSTVMYVFLPSALSLFPMLYWLIGLYCRYRAPEKMTRRQKESGISRLKRCAVGCAVLNGLALLMDAVYLITGGSAGREWPGTLIFAAACLLACLAARHYKSEEGRLLTEPSKWQPPVSGQEGETP